MKTPGGVTTGRKGPSGREVLEHAEHNSADESDCDIRGYNAQSAYEWTYEIHWECSLGSRRARK